MKELLFFTAEKLPLIQITDLFLGVRSNLSKILGYWYFGMFYAVCFNGMFYAIDILVQHLKCDYAII